jgi:hypothetical protein
VKCSDCQEGEEDDSIKFCDDDKYVLENSMMTINTFPEKPRRREAFSPLTIPKSELYGAAGVIVVLYKSPAV